MTISESDSSTFVGFPMPNDSESLTDRKRRPIVRSAQDGPRFPFPVPNGWFVVCEARELLPGELKTFKVFGTDVVLYRGEDGIPRMVEAYCAHLGAHLGVGGRIEGGCIRCPFHGWLYDGSSGRCTEIPYGDTSRIPTKARVRSYPCLERNHMIWAWHHGKEGEPFYDVPEIAEFEDPDWLPYELVEFDVATCCQEMTENNVDFAHFKYVHGTDSIPEDEFLIDGCYKRTSGNGRSLCPRGLRTGARRRTPHRICHVPVIDNPDRHREREGALDLHRSEEQRTGRRSTSGTGLRQRGKSGSADLGEQTVRRPPDCDQDGAKAPRAATVGTAILFVGTDVTWSTGQQGVAHD